MQLELDGFVDQFFYFPGTRYMGSKNKIIHQIWDILKEYEFNSFFDGFAGSNVVGYYMKTRGKKIFTNDFMAISHITSKAIIENSHTILEDSDVDFLLNNPNTESYISKTFKDLYFEDQDNQFLDQLRFNITQLDNEYKQALALSALIRSCMKKRPRGIFTFVGHRYDDGRGDIRKSLKEHFIDNIPIFNKAVFDNGNTCTAYNSLTQNLNVAADLVYFDPPYFTPNSDNDYVRRYHFVEGLAKNWEGLEIQEHTKTKKFKSYKYNLSGDIPVFEILDENQPLLPVSGELSEYQEIELRTTKAQQEVAYYKDQAILERATNAHIALVIWFLKESAKTAGPQSLIN